MQNSEGNNLGERLPTRRQPRLFDTIEGPIRRPLGIDSKILWIGTATVTSLGFISDAHSVFAPFALTSLIVFGILFIAATTAIWLQRSATQRLSTMAVIFFLLAIGSAGSIFIQSVVGATSKKDSESNRTAAAAGSEYGLQDISSRLSENLGKVETTSKQMDVIAKRLGSAGTGPQITIPIPMISQSKVPKLSFSSVNYSKKNESLIALLKGMDGKAVFIDTIDQSDSVSENHQILYKCMGAGEPDPDDENIKNDFSELEFAIPTPSDRNSPTCTYYMSLKILSGGGVPISSGGTGILYMRIRRYFLVNISYTGYKRIFALREVALRK